MRLVDADAVATALVASLGLDRSLYAPSSDEVLACAIRRVAAMSCPLLSDNYTSPSHCSTRIATGSGSLPHEFCYRRGRQGGGDDGEDQRGRETGAGAGDR
jgi:hypothetical protein